MIGASCTDGNPETGANTMSLGGQGACRQTMLAHPKFQKGPTVWYGLGRPQTGNIWF
jgi:hypothetical protein